MQNKSSESTFRCVSTCNRLSEEWVKPIDQVRTLKGFELSGPGPFILCRLSGCKSLPHHDIDKHSSQPPPTGRGPSSRINLDHRMLSSDMYWICIENAVGQVIKAGESSSFLMLRVLFIGLVLIRRPGPWVTLNFPASPVMACDLRLQFRQSLQVYLLFSFVVHFIVSPFFIANIF